MCGDTSKAIAAILGSFTQKQRLTSRLVTLPNSSGPILAAAYEIQLATSGTIIRVWVHGTRWGYLD